MIRFVPVVMKLMMKAPPGERAWENRIRLINAATAAAVRPACFSWWVMRFEPLTPSMRKAYCAFGYHW